MLRLLATYLLALPASAILLHLAANETRCLSESIPQKSMLTGNWRWVAQPDAEADNSTMRQYISISPPAVPSRRGESPPLFESTDAQGHFSVVAQGDGAHQVCVLNGETPQRSVKLQMRTAVEVDNHELVAKKEHVEAIEAELDRMERMAVHVYEEMSYMRSRSDATRALDESTRVPFGYTREQRSALCRCQPACSSRSSSAAAPRC